MKKLQYESNEVRMVKVGEIMPNADQPRKSFEQSFITGLAKGMKEAGITDPLLLRRLEKPVNGCIFEIVKGEQRWRAAKLAGIKEVPALIAIVTDKKEQFRIAFIGDVGRNDLDLPDTARGLKRLEVEEGMSQTEIAQEVGKTQTWVWQRLQLLKLDPAVLERMSVQTPEHQRLTLAKALQILRAPAKDRAGIAAQAIGGRESTADTRSLALKARARVAPVPKRERKSNYAALFKQLAWTIRRIQKEAALITKTMAETSEAEFKGIIAAGQPEQVKELTRQIEVTEKVLALIKQRIGVVKQSA